ncbi:hypothetical protein PRIPAC_78933, partial [Pristionchus pacificus]
LVGREKAREEKGERLLCPLHRLLSLLVAMSVVFNGPGICLVCSTPINSIHFGIDACRACSSFFKRAKLSGKRYPCRQGGGGKCPITRGDNFVCRRCRYDKCVAAGMVYEGLMRPAKRITQETSLKAVTFQEQSSSQSILGRIAREYKSFIDRRRKKEQIVISTSEATERVPHPTEEIYCANFDCTIPTIYIAVAETWNFFKDVFPSLLKHSADDQARIRFLLNSKPGLISRMSYFGATFLKCRYWKDSIEQVESSEDSINCEILFYTNSQIDFSIMCSALICVNMRLPDEWLPLSEGGENRNSLVQSIQLFINDQMEMVIPSLERTQMNDTEMHAILALMLCDSGSSSENLLASLDAIRSEVIRDLRRYYIEEMGLTDYSMRLGNLMSLCHTLREGTCLFQECFRMQVSIFDLYTKETKLKEIFM